MTSGVTEFIGIYDADSTIIGEVSYWLGARVGTRHCSLCEITHGMFTQKSEWKTCIQQLGTPFTTFHRNDAPPEVLQTLNNEFPAVLARTSAGLGIVLTSKDLEMFNGETAKFATWLADYLSMETPSL